ncbi:hypothetical protein SKAU_G00418920 [Synaphobranchus kaupii]|uniref:Ig-like domain-containing protein n=1 Tax=Synaphobranchus kaupii TaxID=118154 RepID=A0A9Q1E687_SYNKA|nr:hypothetical protein SKAU_G00418920 [Synaphobranchus kaupii]
MQVKYLAQGLRVSVQWRKAGYSSVLQDMIEVERFILIGCLLQGALSRDWNTSVSISPSGSVLEGSSVTLTCSSDANPPVQNYTWYKVNGREMNTVGTGQNLTFNVTESSGSEQYYCEAQNQHGKENSTTVQLVVDHFSITWLLIGAAAVAMVIVFLIMMLILKKRRDGRCSGLRMKDTEGVTDGSPPPAEDPVYANHAMATTPPRAPELGGTDPQTLPLAEGQIGEQLEGMTYASIKHSPQSVETQGQDGAAGRGDDVVYSQVAVKRTTQKGKVEDGAGQEEQRLVIGVSMETESLCVEMEKKKEMEVIPECEYSNVVFKNKDVQP